MGTVYGTLNYRRSRPFTNHFFSKFMTVDPGPCNRQEDRSRFNLATVQRKSAEFRIGARQYSAKAASEVTEAINHFVDPLARNDCRATSRSSNGCFSRPIIW